MDLEAARVEPARTAGTSLEFKCRGDSEWASRYFGLAHDALDTHHSMKKHGYPAGHTLFTDRQHTPQPHVTRQDNYHHLRALMICLLALDRMIARQDGRKSG